jgi:DNA-directed RNA polymerase specialized sigma24 family protein
MLKRYGRAIRAYLVALVGQEADDVLSEITIKFLEGKFEHWSPSSGKGRFRDYLKQSVYNAAQDHLRRQRSRGGRHRSLEEVSEPGEEPSPLRDCWLAECRQAVIQGALGALREFQDRHPGNVFHTLVCQLVRWAEEEGKEPTAEELGALLGAQRGRSYTVANVRAQKKRARDKFAELLLEEVRSTLEEPTPEGIQEELQFLGLTAYVHPSNNHDPEALEALAKVQERASQVFRLMARGLRPAEVASRLGVSETRVRSEYRFAKAWLRRHRARREQ